MRWLSPERGERLALDDRGLAYGDGLFETMAIRDGQVRLLDYHLQRLGEGCRALRMRSVHMGEVRRRIEARASASKDGDWVKLIITRGSGTRGYAPPDPQVPVAILTSGGLAAAPERWRLRLCELRLPDAGPLAGIKHLNRLPQVLAHMELAPGEQEGVMRDAVGDIACGIMSNVFVVIGQRILTPDLRRAGVAGVMRRFVRERAAVTVSRVSRGALHRASEVFVTNALRGIVSAGHVDGRALPAATPIADALRTKLAACRP